MIETQRRTVVGIAVFYGKSIEPAFTGFATGQIEETTVIFKIDDRCCRAIKAAEFDIVTGKVKILIVISFISAGRGKNDILKIAFLGCGDG